MKLHTIIDTKRIYIIAIKYKIIKNALTFLYMSVYECIVCILNHCLFIAYMCVSVSFKERGKLVKYITFIFI